VMRHDLGGICMSPDRALSIQERSVEKYDGLETDNQRGVLESRLRGKHIQRFLEFVKSHSNFGSINISQIISGR
jgi:hypothetical protein